MLDTPQGILFLTHDGVAYMARMDVCYTGWEVYQVSLEWAYHEQTCYDESEA